MISGGERLLAVFMAGVFVLIAGCSTFDADYERDNPRDPISTNFIHSNPEQFTVEIDDGVIDIRWDDVSQYNSGYIVEKAIDDSTDFERVAKLPEDAEQFRDPGKQIGLTVYYKISSFDDEEGDEKIVHSETLELSVEAIEAYDGFSSDSNLIKLSWQTEQEFSDGVIIQEKRQGQPEFTTVEVIDFADQESPGGNFEYRSDLETFNLDVRLTAFQYQESEIVPIQHVDKSISINDPGNFNITFINELETRVEWENSVDFADHYLLTVKHEQSGTVQRYELLPDEFSQVIDMEMKRGWSRYSLFGVLEGEQSSTLSEKKFFTVDVPMLTYESKSLSAITLKFGDQSEGQSDEPPRYSAIIVERSVNEGEFETYAELPATQSEFTDTDLHVSNSYSYRGRTLTGVGNQIIDLTNENRLIPVDEGNISIMGDLNIHFPNPNTLAFYKQYSSNSNNSGVEIVDVKNLNDRVKFNSGNKYYKLRLSASGDKLVELIDGEAFGEYNLNIWDLNSNSIVQTISQAHNDSEINYINAALDFSRDDKLVASAISFFKDSGIKIWDLQSGSLLHMIDVPDNQIIHFTFNPVRDELIVSAGRDLRIYETNTFQLISEFKNLFDGSQFNISLPGNGQLAYLYNGMRTMILDLETKSIVKEHDFAGTGFTHLSTNYDGSELFIKIFDWIGIYDGSSFDLSYRIALNNQDEYDNFMVLNPRRNNSAFSFKPISNPEPRTKIVKWGKRDVWYMEPKRQ